MININLFKPYFKNNFNLTLDICVNNELLSFYYIDSFILHKLISNKLNILELCSELRIQIPYFCYHKNLSIAGNCRMCLIEYNNNLKPVVACATIVSKYSIIITNSFFVKRCREHVVEFLLINHPLDCPICDQGGECDLQDLTLIYASDRSRFLEKKRSVVDQSFHPLIKTIMTRCIHCTRCIRYLEEILHYPSLGTMGRGESTIISTYDKSYLLVNNNIGNIIDLCPVGALTSKLYAFKERPWLLNSIECFDLIESNCSPIRIDIKGNLIYRILPRSQNFWYNEYISDECRFGFSIFDINRDINIKTLLLCTNLYLNKYNMYNNFKESNIILNLNFFFNKLMIKKKKISLLFEISIFKYTNIYFNIIILLLKNKYYFIEYNNFISPLNLLILNEYYTVLFNSYYKCYYFINNYYFMTRFIGLNIIELLKITKKLIYLIIGVHLQIENNLLLIKLINFIDNVNESMLYSTFNNKFIYTLTYNYEYSYNISNHIQLSILYIQFGKSLFNLINIWHGKHWLIVNLRFKICIQIINKINNIFLLSIIIETIITLGYYLLFIAFISNKSCLYSNIEFNGLMNLTITDIIINKILTVIYKIIIFSWYINNNNLNLDNKNIWIHIMHGTSLYYKSYFNFFIQSVFNYKPLLYIPIVTIYETYFDTIDNLGYYKKNIPILLNVKSIFNFNLLINLYIFIIKFILNNNIFINLWSHINILLNYNEQLIIYIMHNLFLININISLYMYFNLYKYNMYIKQYKLYNIINICL